MVKAYKQEHVYKHPWERVTSASWRKFADPDDKRTLSHVLQVDTLNRRLDPDTGKLYTTRALTIHAPGPWFVRKIVGQDICHCVESTIVDGQTQSMQLTTRNVSLQKFIEVEEKIRYDPHPDNPATWTLCRQETSIKIKPLSALASMAEKVLIDSCRTVSRVEKLWREFVSILRLNLGLEGCLYDSVITGNIQAFCRR